MGQKLNKVQRGAETNRDRLEAKFRAGIRILAATDALQANGYDEDQVEKERMQMQIGINKTFGVGRGTAEERAAAAARARRAATNTNRPSSWR